MDRSLAIDNAGYLHIAWSGNDGGSDSEIYYARSDAPIAPPANEAPYAPNTPSPMDGASGVSAAAALRWEGGDPDAGDGSSQLALFASSALRPEESEALAALRELDPLRTTPMQALELLSKLADLLRSRS